MQSSNGNGSKSDAAWEFVDQANALSDKAVEKTGEEADRLYQAAYEKYAAALEVDPDEFDALYNWGIALADQARSKTGDEAERLFRDSYEKYKIAHEVEPRDYEILHNWGATLMDHAQIKTGKEVDVLRDEAEEKLKQADALGSDYSAFVLASLAASRGDEDRCKEWLTKAYKSGDLAEIIDKETIEQDPAFDSVRDKDWFKAILKTL